MYLLDAETIHQLKKIARVETVRVAATVQQATVVEYDVAGHPQAEFQFAVTFPYHCPIEGSTEGQACLTPVLQALATGYQLRTAVTAELGAR